MDMESVIFISTTGFCHHRKLALSLEDQGYTTDLGEEWVPKHQTTFNQPNIGRTSPVKPLPTSTVYPDPGQLNLGDLHPSFNCLNDHPLLLSHAKLSGEQQVLLYNYLPFHLCNNSNNNNNNVLDWFVSKAFLISF
jgi:hypothetical protein